MGYRCFFKQLRYVLCYFPFCHCSLLKYKFILFEHFKGYLCNQQVFSKFPKNRLIWWIFQQPLTMKTTIYRHTGRICLFKSFVVWLIQSIIIYIFLLIRLDSIKNKTMQYHTDGNKLTWYFNGADTDTSNLHWGDNSMTI